jgi:hypothetical protein
MFYRAFIAFTAFTSSDFEEFKTDNLLPKKQKEGVRLVGIESREIGLTEICKSNLLQSRPFKAV